MSFLKNLFSRKPKKYVDERGIYFHVQCKRCEKVIKVRADKQYDLNRTDNGFQWRKTIVCPQCYGQISADVTFSSNYQITNQEIANGAFVEQPIS